MERLRDRFAAPRVRPLDSVQCDLVEPDSNDAAVRRVGFANDEMGCFKFVYHAARPAIRDAEARGKLADGPNPVLVDVDCRAHRMSRHRVVGREGVARVSRFGVRPGTVAAGNAGILTGLIKRIAPEATAFATDDASADGGLAVPFLVPSATPAQ